MTLFALWQYILCHAMEQSLAGIKRVINAQPEHPRYNRGRVSEPGLDNLTRLCKETKNMNSIQIEILVDNLMPYLKIS